MKVVTLKFVYADFKRETFLEQCIASQIAQFCNFLNLFTSSLSVILCLQDAVTLDKINIFDSNLFLYFLYMYFNLFKAHVYVTWYTLEAFFLAAEGRSRESQPPVTC